MGHEAQCRIMAASAMVVGLSGLGLEVAKNCVLAGLHHLMLVDPGTQTDYNLGATFCLSEKTAGMSRADACTNYLVELNPKVNVVSKSVQDLSSASLVPLVADVAVIVITVSFARSRYGRGERVLSR